MGDGEIIKVEAAPWLEQYAQEKREQAEQETREIIEMVDAMTDAQLEQCVLMSEHEDVARFFLQKLFQRDKHKAYIALKKWKGEG